MIGVIIGEFKKILRGGPRVDSHVTRWKQYSSLVLVLSIVTAGWGQSNSDSELFRTVRPSYGVVVKPYSNVTDVYEITAINPSETGDSLKIFANALGNELGNGPRALSVFVKSVGIPGQPGLVKANFALDGLRDIQSGGINLQAICRALAVAGGPTGSDGLDLIIENFNPSPATVASFESDQVKIESSKLTSPSGIEYRIHLKTFDPKKIEVPLTSNLEVQSPTKKKGGQPSALLIGLLIGLAIAVAVLVYNLMTGGISRTSGNSGSVNR